MEKNEEYYFVDTGYISSQITRYPEPKILDEKRTYFRICKGSFHTNRGKVNTPARLEKLRRLGIDAEFKGWLMIEVNIYYYVHHHLRLLFK